MAIAIYLIIGELTQLRPLKRLEIRMRIQQPFHSLDILLIFEPRKYLEVVECFGEVSVHQHFPLPNIR